MSPSPAWNGGTVPALLPSSKPLSSGRPVNGTTEYQSNSAISNPGVSSKNFYAGSKSGAATSMSAGAPVKESPAPPSSTAAVLLLSSSLDKQASRKLPPTQQSFDGVSSRDQLNRTGEYIHLCSSYAPNNIDFF